jgi:hypothetical protein
MGGRQANWSTHPPGRTGEGGEGRTSGAAANGSALQEPSDEGARQVPRVAPEPPCTLFEELVTVPRGWSTSAGQNEVIVAHVRSK